MPLIGLMMKFASRLKKEAKRMKEDADVEG